MKRVLGFHDSVVRSAGRDGTDVVVILDPAYVYEAPENPAVEPGPVYRQAVELRFVAGRLRNTLPPDGKPELYGGSVQLDDRTLEEVVPLPFEAGGRATATLAYGHLNAVLEVSGDGFSCRAISPAISEGDFPGAV